MGGEDSNYGCEYAARFVDLEPALFKRLRRIVSKTTLRRSDVVLDVGCGTAMLAAVIAHDVSRVVGVDLSTELLALAERRVRQLGLSNVDLVCSDVISFCSSRRDEFDVAFALDISEHIENDAWVEMLCAVRVALKPGGRLYLHTPNLSFFVERLKDAGVIRQIPGHVAVRTAGQNSKCLSEAGFVILRTVSLPHYNALRFVHCLSPLSSLFSARLLVESKKGEGA